MAVINIDGDTEVIINDVDIDHTVFRIKSRASFSNSAPRLPYVKIFGTGGTIASKGSSSSQTAGYKVDLTIDDLVSSIPNISQFCNLTYEQLLNLDSKDMNYTHLRILYDKVIHALEVDRYDGIVITHGTDTMEETAFFLQLTVKTDKPIVLCGSMRPSTAISADGPMNLYQAIVIASNRELWNRGVLVALNDRIGSGYYITKSNANSLDTFKSIGQGYLGNFVNNEIHYHYPPSMPSGITHFDIGTELVQELAEVPVLYAHQGFNKQMIRMCIEQLGAQGIVFASMGAGSMSDEVNEMAYEMWLEHKVPFIYSKRSMDGMVPKAALPKIHHEGKPAFEGAIAGGYLNPQKARLLLRMSMLAGMDLPQIKRVFEGVYGG
ncbi:hypothetical protein BABINDRAFT_163521 [Babjeviella inositovora NRRL Y-12698]|uniref:asparaginase n=1 Tax=Babjeviella inositovora NRRL Y-12698 TaxID=984486 RepID=A0A1E3QIK1_9ASCO|nr:uncharacterized protein BABINDRAFT_163521 [Babjeviella inositovora NRRL Y-12698]ODQ77519.1 hypothetical protein BABINDRAFT_163521 [Babjeviella inositovora NRRL Y-12698]